MFKKLNTWQNNNTKFPTVQRTTPLPVQFDDASSEFSVAYDRSVPTMPNPAAKGVIRNTSGNNRIIANLPPKKGGIRNISANNRIIANPPPPKGALRNTSGNNRIIANPPPKVGGIRNTSANRIVTNCQAPSKVNTNPPSYRGP